MLEVRGLHGGWGETTVVENLDLTIAVGESVALIGRNGVGKTTTLELITGRARRHSGRIHLDGEDLSEVRTYARSRAGIGYVPQEREVFASLTVRENLSVARRPGPWTEERLFALFPSLAERASSLGGRLSGGEQQMLSIARALRGNPKLLLMDEPTEGLAPIVVEQLTEAIRQITRSGGLAVLIVEQRIDLALELTDRCLVMDRGQIVADSPSAQLAGQDWILAAIIGLEHAAEPVLPS
ncbi:MAG: ABC transporter ATP-binding protein [Xanthobacteraceae bacterium]